MTTNPDFGFCRDCLSDLDRPSRRCPQCGSPRIVRHPEIDRLTLAHIDCDAFFAAVEKRDNPDLADKPVIVGGGKRGVVSTACYIARIEGVKSAMPMFKALEACPDAVVIKPDIEKYARVGRQVRAMMQDLTPMVQPISIDEAFLDLAGTQKLHKDTAARTLAKFARRVQSEIGISVSIGLSYCKFLAKVASDLEKPRGFAIIGRNEAIPFLADKPVSLIWGVGQSFAERLRRDGIERIGHLQSREEADLMQRYGTMGQRLFRLARGEDDRRVEPREAAKSVSAETTFAVDFSRAEDLVPVLRSLSEGVALRLKKAGISGQTVVLKLKTSDFRTRTRNRRLDDPTRYADRIFQTGLAMLEREIDGTAYRLLGIGVSDLTGLEHADPPDLVDPGAARRAIAETAMDAVRERFGRKSLETGYTFGRASRGRPR